MHFNKKWQWQRHIKDEMGYDVKHLKSFVWKVQSNFTKFWSLIFSVLQQVFFVVVVFDENDRKEKKWTGSHFLSPASIKIFFFSAFWGWGDKRFENPRNNNVVELIKDRIWNVFSSKSDLGPRGSAASQQDNNNRAGARKGVGSCLEESSSPPWPVWWWSYIPCPGLQGSDTRPYFFMWAAHCCAAVGVAPFVAALPLLEKKTCMISYMKDICNWTAGP